jgi:diguanylate cyclase (GGDEF)-like protein
METAPENTALESPADNRPGWLCPTEIDRQRAVDTSRRVRSARLLGSAFVGAGLIVYAPLSSWWLLALFAVSTLNMITIDRRMARSEHPERHAAASMVFTLGVLVVGALITGGPQSPLLPLLILPVGLSPARFREQVVVVFTAITALAIAGVALSDYSSLVDSPGLTIVTLVLMGSVVAITMAIRGAEVQHRSESVLDPLTGLLNRKALETRFAELEELARLTGGSVCVIETDVDHFKRVNDTLGHEAGDAALRDVAYTMRKSLRSFELMYRLGGEEFLIVLPRVGLREGAWIGERLRKAVERARPGGQEITISLGVAAAHGDDVVYDHLFAAADEALYEAKHAGRNRVVSRPLSSPEGAVPAAPPPLTRPEGQPQPQPQPQTL